MRNPSIILAVAAMTVVSSAKAQTSFSDDQIRSALVGNTISGSSSENPMSNFCGRTGASTAWAPTAVTPAAGSSRAAECA